MGNLIHLCTFPGNHINAAFGACVHMGAGNATSFLFAIGFFLFASDWGIKKVIGFLMLRLSSCAYRVFDVKTSQLCPAVPVSKVAGGCDLIRKTMSAFVPDSVQTCLMVDLHCYDCWPALAALEDINSLYNCLREGFAVTKNFFL